MTPIAERLMITSVDKLSDFQDRSLTHMISVSNPGNPNPKPHWFLGPRLELYFGDVVSERDAQQCRTKAVSSQGIQEFLGFSRRAWSDGSSRLLVHCDYGASRSPAVAYVCLADQLGAGNEREALMAILNIRPCAVPNGRVVELADVILGRKGMLMAPLKEFYRAINQEIDQAFARRSNKG